MGLTGAWFSDKAGAKESSSSLKFGKIGSVSISLSGVSAKDASNAAVSGRDLMPGDKVEAGGITLTYTAATGERSKVYYVVYDGAKYYTLTGTNNALVEASAPAEIESGIPVVFAGSVLSVSLDGTTYYALNGNNDGTTSGDSWEVPNTFQTKTLAELSSKVGGFAYAVGSQAYGVGIIQFENAGDNGANVFNAVKAEALAAYTSANSGI